MSLLTYAVMTRVSVSVRLWLAVDYDCLDRRRLHHARSDHSPRPRSRGSRYRPNQTGTPGHRELHAGRRRGRVRRRHRNLGARRFEEGFKSVINLRSADRAGRQHRAECAPAKEIGLNYFSIPFNGQAPETKTVDAFLGDHRQQVQPAGLHPLRIGEPCRRHVDGEAGAAGRLGHRQGDRGGQAHWPAQSALEQFAVEYINTHKK